MAVRPWCIVAAAFTLSACAHAISCPEYRGAQAGVGASPGRFNLETPTGLKLASVEGLGYSVFDSWSGEWIASLQLDYLGCIAGRSQHETRAALDPTMSVSTFSELAWHPVSGGPGSFAREKRSFWGPHWALDPYPADEDGCVLLLETRMDVTPSQSDALRALMQGASYTPPH